MNPFIMHAVIKKAKKTGKIKNLNVDLDPVILLMVLGVPTLIGGGLFAIVNEADKKEQQNKVQEAEIIEKLDPVKFEAGEHIISVPIKEDLSETQVFEYHPGYKPVGIASSKYGKSYELVDSFLLYINETEVEAKVTSIDNDNYKCEEFGIPLNSDFKEISEDTYTINYPEGTHIISVPVKNKEDVISQFEFHDGYEPIGFATANRSTNYNLLNDSAILYINVEPVEVEKNEENNKKDFGTPKEEQKVNIKK